jgi:hypothetical protein
MLRVLCVAKILIFFKYRSFGPWIALHFTLYIYFVYCICWSDIFRLENLSVWQIPVFRDGLLMRNRGYSECETLEKWCWSYLRNIKAAINYFYKNFPHNLTIFLIGKMFPNIGIFQTLGFSILKMSPQDNSVGKLSIWELLVWKVLFITCKFIEGYGSHWPVSEPDLQGKESWPAVCETMPRGSTQFPGQGCHRYVYYSI